VNPSWLPFCSKVQAPGIAKAFSKGVPSPGGTIGDPKLQRHSPVQWSLSVSMGSGEPLHRHLHYRPFGGPVEGHQGLRVNRHGFDPAPSLLADPHVEWPRFHLVSKGRILVSSIRPLVSQFLPGGGKHETRHTAGSTFPNQSVSASPHDRPVPFSLHAAHPQIPGWHALMRCKNNTLFSTWTA
jgi:hypothetical protein